MKKVSVTAIRPVQVASTRNIQTSSWTHCPEYAQTQILALASQDVLATELFRATEVADRLPILAVAWTEVMAGTKPEIQSFAVLIGRPDGLKVTAQLFTYPSQTGGLDELLAAVAPPQVLVSLSRVEISSRGAAVQAFLTKTSVSNVIKCLP